MAIKDSDALDPSLSFENDIVLEFSTDSAIFTDYGDLDHVAHAQGKRPHIFSRYYKNGPEVPIADENSRIPLINSGESISFSDFYGSTNTIFINFFEKNGTTNYYIDNAGDSTDALKGTHLDLYDIASDFVTPINSNIPTPVVVTFDSDVAFNYGISTGGQFSDLTIINAGIIAGRGGAGGSNGGGGGAGQNAITISANATSIIIENLNGGIISGGGGGGRGRSLSAYGVTTRSGGGGGWNGGRGGNSSVSGAAGSGSATGGAGQVVTSKSSSATGGGGPNVRKQVNGSAGSVEDAAGGLGGGAGGAQFCAYSSGSPATYAGSAGTGSGGGNRPIATASGAPGPNSKDAFASQRIRYHGGAGGTNTGAGTTRNGSGGGGGWGAAGGAGGAGGKAIKNSATVDSLLYIGDGIFYGTNDGTA